MGVSARGDVLVVRHEGKGSAESGRQLADELARYLEVRSARQGRIIVYHEATALEDAETGYATAFASVEHKYGKAVECTVCAISNLWLRAMIRSVAAVSGKPWHIFTGTEKAEAFLAELPSVPAQLHTGG